MFIRAASPASEVITELERELGRQTSDVLLGDLGPGVPQVHCLGVLVRMTAHVKREAVTEVLLACRKEDNAKRTIEGSKQFNQ